MAEPVREARQAAVQLLARREHSRRELSRKLRERGHDADAVEQALDALERERLLSDVRYAESYVRMRAAKGYGPQRLRHELRERGVDEPLIRQQVEAYGGDWYQLARRARQKRFGETSPANTAEYARQVRFLQYRGFDGEQIRSAFEDDAD